MGLDLLETMALLSRTPETLSALLRDLSPSWSAGNEGPNTWSPRDVVAHLVHCERVNWISRIERILAAGEARAFDPFDPHGFRGQDGKPLGELLDDFAALRAASLETLRGLDLTPERLELKGRHPEFSAVTLGQLLATWTAHDLGHVAQIARVMAKQVADHVGPWRAYLSVLAPRPGSS